MTLSSGGQITLCISQATSPRCALSRTSEATRPSTCCSDSKESQYLSDCNCIKKNKKKKEKKESGSICYSFYSHYLKTPCIFFILYCPLSFKPFLKISVFPFFCLIFLVYFITAKHFETHFAWKTLSWGRANSHCVVCIESMKEEEQ